ncbi:MAG: hypothetical protein COB17_10595 [Sulfurimonas sp.]|nr:MAG: hypothetical protein COB17_10595 [Sulfurimonas sp.]
MKTQTLEYNKETGQITICEYDDGFLDSSTDVTDAVMTLALEKLYDDYDLDLGDELLITKKKSLKNLTKFEISNKR